MAKIVNGDEIEFSCIRITTEDYYRAVRAVEDIHWTVCGFVVDGCYRPSEDTDLICRNHWSLSVLKENKGIWIIVNKHPGDLYEPMSYIREQSIYHVVKYDIWHIETGYVAVVTETDED